METEPEPRSSAPRRVEAYLDQILAPLARRLSPFHHEELRRELREHLWARVDAYRELGQSEDEAVTEALRQFGGAQNFLRQWRREWAKTPQRLTLREIWEAARPAWLPSLLGIAIAFLPCLAVQVCYQNLQGSPAGVLLYSWRDGLFRVLIWCSFLLLPALVGARQGRRTPKRAGIGMMTVLTAEILAASLLYEFTLWALPLGSYAWSEASILFPILWMALATWLPVAGGAAAISGWWMRRSQTHRLA